MLSADPAFCKSSKSNLTNMPESILLLDLRMGKLFIDIIARLNLHSLPKFYAQSLYFDLQLMLEPKAPKQRCLKKKKQSNQWSLYQNEQS
jgi:hypothetical protein